MTTKLETLPLAALQALKHRIANAKNTETTTTLLLEALLLSGHLAPMWQLPGVVSWRFEAPADGCRIDLLMEHEDGSTSLVEAKGDVDAGELARGIGQLFLYAAILNKPCRLILCSTASVPKAFNAIRACERAGVQYGFLSSFDEFRLYSARFRGD